MNAELQKCRRHYENLPPHVKARNTAQHLLRAIHMTEAILTAVENYLNTNRLPDVALAELRQAIARVTKEGA